MATAHATDVDVELDQLRALGKSGRAAALRAMRAPAPGLRQSAGSTSGESAGLIAARDPGRKPKSYKGSVCGAEIPDLPMPALKHQMLHANRRPFAGNREPPAQPPDRQPVDASLNRQARTSVCRTPGAARALADVGDIAAVDQGAAGGAHREMIAEPGR